MLLAADFQHGVAYCCLADFAQGRESAVLRERPMTACALQDVAARKGGRWLKSLWAAVWDTVRLVGLKQ